MNTILDTRGNHVIAGPAPRIAVQDAFAPGLRMGQKVLLTPWWWSAVQLVAGATRRVPVGLRQWHNRRTLYALSDRTLADIGITRAEVPSAARKVTRTGAVHSTR